MAQPCLQSQTTNLVPSLVSFLSHLDCTWFCLFYFYDITPHIPPHTTYTHSQAYIHVHTLCSSSIALNPFVIGNKAWNSCRDSSEDPRDRSQLLSMMQLVVIPWVALQPYPSCISLLLRGLQISKSYWFTFPLLNILHDVHLPYPTPVLFYHPFMATFTDT